MDSQAATFRDWLFSAAGYTDIALMNMTEPEAICILCTYLDHTAQSRKNPTTNNPVMAKTLVWFGLVWFGKSPTGVEQRACGWYYCFTLHTPYN